MNVFKENISKDYAKKKEDLEQVISKFESSVTTIKCDFENEVKNHQDAIVKLHQNNHEELKELQKNPEQR